MHSQIFQDKRWTESNNTTASHIPPGVMQTIYWIITLLIIMSVILYPERPAWGHDLTDKAGLSVNLTHSPQ